MRETRQIAVGYAGGHTLTPTYKQVCTGQTGHAEVVQLTFSPSKVSFEDLVDFFYRSHEPFTLNRQGNDVGTQYRSVIFYTSPEQKEIAAKVTERAQKAFGSGLKICTTLEPAGTFYPAEDGHQDYLTKNPHGYECATHFGMAPVVEMMPP